MLAMYEKHKEDFIQQLTDITDNLLLIRFSCLCFVCAVYQIERYVEWLQATNVDEELQLHEPKRFMICRM